MWCGASSWWASAVTGRSSWLVSVEIRWDNDFFPLCRDYCQISERRRKVLPRGSCHLNLGMSVLPSSPRLLYELVVGPPLNSNLECLPNSGRDLACYIQIFSHCQIELTRTSQAFDSKVVQSSSLLRQPTCVPTDKSCCLKSLAFGLLSSVDQSFWRMNLQTLSSTGTGIRRCAGSEQGY